MEVDYIVVGAGSAGCVIASRLSEDPHVSVLLLEAGGEDEKAEIHIPRLWPSLLGSEVDWGYTSEPEPVMADRRIGCQRGKVLGGTSAINAMIYIRGNRWDFDHWSELGCSGWGYERVLPYFLKSENQERGPSPFHRVGGPLTVSDAPQVHPYYSEIFDAAAKTGILPNEDFNGPRQDGSGIYQFTVKDRVRQSTAAAFLKPVRERPNLRVATNAMANRIVIKDDRAVGVAYMRDGVEELSLARREVILSAGTYNSPQLLMLSGIGPGAELRELGIPVIKDLPGVGRNLHDHPTVSLRFAASSEIPVPEEHILGGAFLYSGVDPQEPAPDIQFHIGIDSGDQGSQTIAVSLHVTLLRPVSRGQVRLGSSNSGDAPRIEINLLADPNDMKRMVSGVHRAREVWQALSLAKPGVFSLYPGPDQEIEPFIRSEGWAIWHPVGTCKMGVDELAVVDPELRVYGIYGLRVADASVMPQVTSGNTNAPTIMIAERAAEWAKMTQPAARSWG